MKVNSPCAFVAPVISPGSNLTRAPGSTAPALSVARPLIAGVAYELIRFAAKRRGSFLATLTAPGLWMQRITTKPPADDQTAIAIHALEGAMQLEAKQGGQLVIA